jgi:hypothetical protein
MINRAVVFGESWIIIINGFDDLFQLLASNLLAFVSQTNPVVQLWLQLDSTKMGSKCHTDSLATIVTGLSERVLEWAISEFGLLNQNEFSHLNVINVLCADTWARNVLDHWKYVFFSLNFTYCDHLCSIYLLLKCSPVDFQIVRKALS